MTGMAIVVPASSGLPDRGELDDLVLLLTGGIDISAARGEPARFVGELGRLAFLILGSFSVVSEKCVAGFSEWPNSKN